MTTLALLLCILSNGSSGALQSAIPEGMPLVITNQGVRTNTSGQVVITYSLANRSSKEISAYAVLVTFFARSGKPSSTMISRAATRGVFPLSGPDVMPGKTWIETIRGVSRNLDDGSPMQYSLEVDYVYFADGTSWGRDTSKNGPYFEGLKEGARMMRTALREKVREKGITALQDFLVEQ